MAISITPETRKMLRQAGYTENDIQHGLTKEQYQRLSGQGIAREHPQGYKVGQQALDAMRAYAMTGGNSEKAKLMAKSTNGDTGATLQLKKNFNNPSDSNSSATGLSDPARGYKLEAHFKEKLKREEADAESRGNVLKHVNGQTVEVAASQDVNERFDHSGAGAGAATPFGANGVQNPHGVDY